ncbi:Hypothetical protein SMAX5B_018062 [Scophthalmus maximus]|uniref:Uncharacterized protein n=1 Tax=Scophthalmus maximus TaxID=52904 RepID=A0A2U9CDY7_SCOMX|nr:Hypothetical protein SMAX5B_018062 [Scophthalmus maximus]
MDEFMAFSHTFCRVVLSSGAPEGSGSQPLHESFRSLFNYSAGSHAGDGNGGPKGQKSPVYCKSRGVVLSESQAGAERCAAEGSGSTEEIETKFLCYG